MILRAHNEESRVLKMKIRQAQDSNKKMSQSIKKKDYQILNLLEENKQLKKINSLERKDEAHVLEGKLSDVTLLLDSRDNEFKVFPRRDCCYEINDFRIFSRNKIFWRKVTGSR